MKPALRFLAKVAAFGAIFAAGVLALGSLKAKKAVASDFVAAIADKHARLAAIPSPRIILGGGSNLVFGVDSAAVEQALRLPVVNLSLHAGLGLRFIINEMADSWRPHDIVVLSVEYYLPLSRPDQYSLLRTASDAYPRALAYYQRDLRADVSLFVEHHQALLRSMFARKAVQEFLYTRSAFTERGDNVGQLKAIRPVELRDRLRLAGGLWEGIAALNDFADAARRHDVRVFFVYPSYAASEYEKNRDILEGLDKELRQTLRMELLGTPRDAVYPDDQFFDTIYHLDRNGRQQRTRDLIRLLAAKLRPSPETGPSQASR